MKAADWNKETVDALKLSGHLICKKSNHLSCEAYLIDVLNAGAASSNAFAGTAVRISSVCQIMLS